MNQRPDQIDFERLVKIYHQRHQNELKLDSPKFGCVNGAISRAVMHGSDGFVEILYGPPEFHVDMSITLLKEQKRWEGKDFMNIKTVREWLINYSQRPIPQGKSALEREIEWVFLNLSDALKNVAGFDWLKERSEAE